MAHQPLFQIKTSCAMPLKVRIKKMIPGTGEKTSQPNIFDDEVSNRLKEERAKASFQKQRSQMHTEPVIFTRGCDISRQERIFKQVDKSGTETIQLTKRQITEPNSQAYELKTNSGFISSTLKSQYPHAQASSSLRNSSNLKNDSNLGDAVYGNTNR